MNILIEKNTLVSSAKSIDDQQHSPAILCYRFGCAAHFLPQTNNCATVMSNCRYCLHLIL